MTSTRSSGQNARSLAWLGIAGVLILALGARTGVAAIAPIAHEIELDVELGGIWLGLLGMIPPISYALAGLFTPRIVRKLSLEGLAVAVSALTAAAHIARGFIPNYVGLFISTVVLMLGVGAINVILPGLVKLYASHHIGPVTSLYSTAMAISTAAPAAVGLWLAEAYDWRWSLASWSVISAVAMLPWLVLLPRAWSRRSAERADLGAIPELPRLGDLAKSATARSIMLIFSVSGLTAYSIFALLPPVLVDLAGSTPEEAAAAVAVFSIMGMPMSLTIPLLAVRRGWAQRLVAFGAAAGVSGFLGLAFIADVAPLLWAVLTALGTLHFSMSLALIGARTLSHHMATNLSGFVNTLGYSVAALGPVVTGILHEITGSWVPSLLVLAAASLVALSASVVFARENTVEAELDDATVG